MSYESPSPVRAAIKTEILAALTSAGAPLTAGQLADICPSAPDANEIARVAYEMRTKKGLIEFGDDALEPGKRPVKTYQLMSADSAESWAARVSASDAVAKAQAPKKPKKATVKPASPAHPWKQAVVPPKAPRAPRVTRPLPSHLQTTQPPVAPAVGTLAHSFGPFGTLAASPETTPTGPFVVVDGQIALQPQADIDAALIAALQEAITDIPQATTEEEIMSQDPAPYIAAPDTFVLEPESAADEAPSHVCQGHCSNHAVEQERQAMMDAVARDLLENCRLAIVDAMLLRASRALTGDHEWQALERAYIAAAGASLEVCHG